jgi:ribosomal protein S2
MTSAQLHPLVGQTDIVETKRTISHVEAKEIARRFIGGHFSNTDADGRRIHPRITIPANTERDDDILLVSYIEQQRKENERLRTALRAVRACTDPAWAAQIISDALRETK